MNFTQKIKAVMGYSGISQRGLAEALDTSPQNLNAKLTKDSAKYTAEELEKIAHAMGAEFRFSFRMKDGTEI